MFWLIVLTLAGAIIRLELLTKTKLKKKAMIYLFGQIVVYISVVLIFYFLLKAIYKYLKHKK